MTLPLKAPEESVIERLNLLLLELTWLFAFKLIVLVSGALRLPPSNTSLPSANGRIF